MPTHNMWMRMAMGHGAGDAALMRELDWITRHRCLLFFLTV